jgi:hypothetical protein
MTTITPSSRLEELAALSRVVSAMLEAAYRDGWRDGYRAGRVDGGSDFDWCDPDADWRKSETAKSIQLKGEGNA